MVSFKIFIMLKITVSLDCTILRSIWAKKKNCYQENIIKPISILQKEHFGKMSKIMNEICIVHLLIFINPIEVRKFGIRSRLVTRVKM